MSDLTLINFFGFSCILCFRHSPCLDKKFTIMLELCSLTLLMDIWILVFYWRCYSESSRPLTVTESTRKAPVQFFIFSPDSIVYLFDCQPPKCSHSSFPWVCRYMFFGSSLSICLSLHHFWCSAHGDRLIFIWMNKCSLNH